MNVNRDSDLAHIREARIRISEEFHNDPELLVKHYIELQERHCDRLAYSPEAGVQDQPEPPRGLGRIEK
jgi:hypothetical protein